jgi:predicted TIM-barrel fold metal-dependent hydrolase
MDLQLISVDDHVIEAPDVWTSRLPAKYHGSCLRYVIKDGSPTWLFEDKEILPFRGDTNGSVWPVSERRPVWEPPFYEELLPSVTHAGARLESMDQDGIEAAVLFPNMIRFCGQLLSQADDRELALLSIRAYNDWLFDEWAAVAPERFIPLPVIPLWSPTLAAAELERMAARGAKAFSFSAGPHLLGLPSIHDRNRFWDPVFSTADDTGLVICMHLGSSSNMPRTSPDAPPGVGMALFQLQGQEACLDWLYSGHFERFPNLQICLSECGVGWVPAVLGLADWSYNMARERSPQPGQLENTAVRGAREGSEQTKLMARIMEARSKKALDQRHPREIFRDHIFVCLIEEVHALPFYEEIGLDNIMVETDYPHTASRWPNSIEYVGRATPGMPDTDRARIFSGNARRLFGLGPAGEAQKKEWRASRPAPAEVEAESELPEELWATMEKMQAGLKGKVRVDS